MPAPQEAACTVISIASSDVHERRFKLDHLSRPRGHLSRPPRALGFSASGFRPRGAEKATRHNETGKKRSTEELGAEQAGRTDGASDVRDSPRDPFWQQSCSQSAVSTGHRLHRRVLFCFTWQSTYGCSGLRRQSARPSFGSWMLCSSVAPAIQGLQHKPPINLQERGSLMPKHRGVRRESWVLGAGLESRRWRGPEAHHPEKTHSKLSSVLHNYVVVAVAEWWIEPWRQLGRPDWVAVTTVLRYVHATAAARTCALFSTAVRPVRSPTIRCAASVPYDSACCTAEWTNTPNNGKTVARGDAAGAVRCCVLAGATTTE